MVMRAYSRKWSSPLKRTYNAWKNMMARCGWGVTKREDGIPQPIESYRGFKRYGGRTVPIEVCATWLDVTPDPRGHTRGFWAFKADMGIKPYGKSLDRINNNDDYYPKNCRWATDIEQARNKSTNRLITAEGQTHPMVVWAEKMQIPYAVITYRLAKGWSEEAAVLTPYTRKEEKAIQEQKKRDKQKREEKQDGENHDG